MRMPWKRAAARPKLRTTDDRMTLTEHLAELRTRIIRSALAVAVGFIVVMAFYGPILEFLRKPYDRACAANPDFECTPLAILGPLEGFSTRIRVAMYGGIILAIPVLLWQIWRFIVPGLEERERKYAIPFIASVIVLFALGGFIAYWTLDKALEFLIDFSGPDVQQVFQISKYISLVGLMVAAFGIGLEFPVLLVFLQLAGVLDHRLLFRQWRLAIVLIVALAAIITPSGDPISLAALSVPMVVFYFVAAIIGRIVQRRREAAEAAASS
jgi:sec-independent protein translocase protein TatC